MTSSQPPPILSRQQVAVRWGDMDAFGHVNNAHYLRYLEEARVSWLHAVAGPLDGPVAPVLAASQLNYRHPIGWPAQVVIELSVTRLGNSSLTLGHRMTAADDPQLIHCDGSVVLVWVDRQAGTSVPLPESVRAACR